MTDPSDAMMQLASACVWACMTGNKTITITLKAKRSREFPRGELLSVGSDGSHNYAMDPVRVLAWIRDQNAKAREGSQPVTSPPAQPAGTGRRPGRR